MMRLVASAVAVRTAAMVLVVARLAGVLTRPASSAALATLPEAAQS
jgi:hypothetical protein